MAAIRIQLLAAVGVISLLAAVTSAQDFHKEYGAGSTLIIHNVSGNVIVKGYNGNQIVVDGLATGADRTKVSVEDLSQGDRVELRAGILETVNVTRASTSRLRFPALYAP